VVEKNRPAGRRALPQKSGGILRVLRARLTFINGDYAA
jgi:hypothetical protein